MSFDEGHTSTSTPGPGTGPGVEGGTGSGSKSRSGARDIPTYANRPINHLRLDNHGSIGKNISNNTFSGMIRSPTKSTHFQCQHCNRTFTVANDLFSHAQKEHNGAVAVSSNPYPHSPYSEVELPNKIHPASSSSSYSHSSVEAYDYRCQGSYDGADAGVIDLVNVRSGDNVSPGQEGLGLGLEPGEENRSRIRQSRNPQNKQFVRKIRIPARKSKSKSKSKSKFEVYRRQLRGFIEYW